MRFIKISKFTSPLIFVLPKRIYLVSNDSFSVWESAITFVVSFYDGTNYLKKLHVFPCFTTVSNKCVNKTISPIFFIHTKKRIFDKLVPKFP